MNIHDVEAERKRRIARLEELEQKNKLLEQELTKEVRDR